jgi:hypothetical protein
MDDGKDGLDYRSNCGEGLSTSRERSKQSWARGIVSREAEEESSRVWKGIREGKRQRQTRGGGFGIRE